MQNLIGKIKIHDQIRWLCRISSAPRLSLLQFNQNIQSVANPPKPKSENPIQDSFPAAYLRNKLGFPPATALAYSKHLSFSSPEKPDSIVAFFKSQNFTDAQISLLVRKWPTVFDYMPESSFLPKIEFLRHVGIPSPDIAKILTFEPNLLGRDLESQIIPCANFLGRFLRSNVDVVFSIKRYPAILMEDLNGILLPNAGILSGVGVPESHIAALLKTNPRTMTVNPESLRSTVEEVQKMGLDPRMKNFMEGVVVMRQLGHANWKVKIDFYKKWGFSEHQLMTAFKKHPRFMAVSEDEAARTLDILLNMMGCDVTLLVWRPEVLSMSFENAIAPRCAFYQALVSKGLIKQDSKFSLMMLACSKKFFLERYVKRYEEKDPKILELYEGIFSRVRG